MDVEEPSFLIRSVSWNPWHGCHRVSEGCRNCYMFIGNEKRGIANSNIVQRSRTQFDYPLKKDKHGRYAIRDSMVLTSMSSDFFISEADEWRGEAWNIIRKRSDLTFVILTKRPERIADNLPNDWNDGYPNVRLSVSVEDQSSWDRRVSILLEVPSKKRDVFMAPMIGKIDTDDLLLKKGINGIYVGGEYGGEPRPCDLEWVKIVRESCVRNGVTFFWRNTGTFLVKDGETYRFDSIIDQSRLARTMGLDHIVDPVFECKNIVQKTLF